MRQVSLPLNLFGYDVALKTLLFIVLIFSSSSAYSCKELKVAGSNQWIPFAYVDSAQPTVPRGIAYDVAKLVSEELGIPLNIEVGLPWKRIENGLETGTIDLLAGNYWNLERAEKWLITDAFAQDEVRVFVRKETHFDFKSLKDLKGLRGAMPRGISLGEAFDSYKANLEVYEVNLHTQMFAMLMRRHVDYMVLPYFNGVIKRASLGYGSSVIALPSAVSVNSVHLSYSKQSPCKGLLVSTNEVIKKAKHDGRIQTIVESYLR